MSIILAPADPEPIKKIRVIDIFKEDVYKSIEAITQKRTDAQGDAVEVKVKDALAADSAEDLDGLVLSEHVAIRDAALRKRLQRVLVRENVLRADNHLEADEKKFTYVLRLPDSFADTTLKPLARFMHRYIVYGVLFDWYSEMGLVQQASIYGPQMTQMEEEIAGALKGPSIVNRPAQPFGPAGKLPI